MLLKAGDGYKKDVSLRSTEKSIDYRSKYKDYSERDHMFMICVSRFQNTNPF